MALQSKDLTEGQVHSAQVVQDLKRTQIVQYAGASGDYNPIHTDEPYARDIAGYPTVFAHGMLTMGMTGAMLTDYVGDGRLTKFGVRFTSQVWPGDDLEASATFEGLEASAEGILANFAVETINQDGAVVLKGYAQARVD
ncbi:MAG: MaoC/PaaZ C-terminal domain-containing protein [Halioglobus sp.]